MRPLERVIFAARARGKAKRWPRWFGAGAAMIGAAAVAAFLLPGLRPPPPDGPFAVGTAAVVLAGVAEIPVAATLWYPTGAPGRRPVILSLPGWLGLRRDMTALDLGLASRGYLVVALDDVGHAAQAAEDDTAPMDFSSETGFAATRIQATARLIRSVARVRDALDGLARLDAGPSSFAGRLDLARVGIVGFSFGGAIAAEALRADPRITAAVNLDGWLFGEAAADGVPGPYLLLTDDTPMPMPSDLVDPDPARRANAILSDADDRNQSAQMARHGGVRLQVAGTGHTNFSDLAFRSRWRRLTGAGSIDPARAIAITRRYVAAFLDEALLGEPSPLLRRVPSEDPEVRLERWPAAADTRPLATLSAAPR